MVQNKKNCLPRKPLDKKVHQNKDLPQEGIRSETDKNKEQEQAIPQNKTVYINSVLCPNCGYVFNTYEHYTFCSETKGKEEFCPNCKEMVETKISENRMMPSELKYSKENPYPSCNKKG